MTPFARRIVLACALVFAVAAMAPRGLAASVRHIVLIAGTKTHGPGEHEYAKSMKLLKVLLDRAPNLDGISTAVYFDGWPDDPKVLDTADAIVAFSDGMEQSPLFGADERVALLEKQMKRGCGFVTIHFTTYIKARYAAQALEWGGGFFDYDGDLAFRSAQKIAEADMDLASPAHAVSRGVEPFHLRDEFYYKIHFREHDARFSPILRTPGLAEDPAARTVAWAVQRQDGGRGFETTTGHFYENWRNDNYRKLLLNAIVWSAGAEVPRGGVESAFAEDYVVDKALGTKRLVAYYYHDPTAVVQYTAAQIPYTKLTHLIHVAVRPTAAADGTVRISDGALEPTLVPQAHAAGVRVLACVQGPAAVFSKIGAEGASRTRFATSLKEVITQYNYDGVDIDWEVPQGKTDVANCTLMMQAVRDVLPAPKYLVSMATTSTPGHWGEFDFKGLTPILDFYNVMTYDFHGPWTDHTGHNSPLYPSTGDPGHDGSLDDTVNAYLNQWEVPPEKINLGTAFYGYQFPTAQLSAACKCEKTTLSRNYGPDIKPKINRDGWVRRVDPVSMAPYLVHEGDPAGFITYDDPESTTRKVVYALETHELGGVFMWEISSDFDGAHQDLMDAMYKAYRRAATRNIEH
jgi:type 1 glutamine amidotransferase